MDKGVQKPVKRSTKFVHGDHITRSEYDDGVLRNNNRVSNRLSREMQMYEKAQKVIMKDLGKETQLLRAKLTNTSITSPRMALKKNLNPTIEPFTVYGMSANPTSKRIKNSNSLRPMYLSSVDHLTPSVSGITSRGSYSSRNSILESRSSVVELQTSVLDSRNSFSESRNGLLEPVGVETASRNSGLNSRKFGSRTRKLGSTRGVINPKTGNAAIMSKTENSLRTENEVSVIDRKTGRTSALSENMSKINTTPPESRISFIDILADVEERKAKETEVSSSRQRSDYHVLRPRSPRVMADLDKSDDVTKQMSEYSIIRRSSHHNVTPGETEFTAHQK